MFIKLIHLRSGRPTFIDVNTITCVRESVQGDTLVLFGKEGQYVVEEVQLVVDTIESIKLGGGQITC
jgi:hypothetical protein